MERQVPAFRVTVNWHGSGKYHLDIRALRKCGRLVLTETCAEGVVALADVDMNTNKLRSDVRLEHHIDKL